MWAAVRILEIAADPCHTLSYRSASSTGPRDAILAVHWARVDRLPTGIDAVVVASDLQGRENPRGGDSAEARLVGEVLAEDLSVLSELGEMPPAERVSVVLAGDLYASEDLEMGATGDVRPVWLAFASLFRWVAGVAGNHDNFGADPAQEIGFAQRPGMHLLDGDAVDLDGLVIAGLGGVIGNTRRPRRREGPRFREELVRLVRARPDVVVLHESPALPDLGRRGHPMVSEGLRDAQDLLVVCGHVHWDQPLVNLRPGVQVVNVDARVMVLTADPLTR